MSQILILMTPDEPNLRPMAPDEPISCSDDLHCAKFLPRWPLVSQILMLMIPDEPSLRPMAPNEPDFSPDGPWWAKFYPRCNDPLTVMSMNFDEALYNFDFEPILYAHVHIWSINCVAHMTRSEILVTFFSTQGHFWELVRLTYHACFWARISWGIQWNYFQCKMMDLKN